MDAQGILEKVKGVKSIEKDNYLLDKSKGTLTSVLIGGGLGFFLAKNYKQNPLMGAIIGATLAGLVTNILVNK